MKSPAAVSGGKGRGSAGRRIPRGKRNVERLPRVSERRERYSKSSGSEVDGDSKSVDVVSQTSRNQGCSGSKRKAYRKERKAAHLMKSQRTLDDDDEEEGDLKKVVASSLSGWVTYCFEKDQRKLVETLAPVKSEADYPYFRLYSLWSNLQFNLKFDDDRWLLQNWPVLERAKLSHSDPITSCLLCRINVLQIEKARREKLRRNPLPPKPGQDYPHESKHECVQAGACAQKCLCRPQLSVAEGRVDFGVASASPPPAQGFLELSSTPPAEEERDGSSDVEEQHADEATLRPFATLPSGILCKILTNLDAENLTRIERVCRAWQRVAKHAWTNATASNLDLAKYYMRNCVDEVLRKCGPYIKKFVFTPKLEHHCDLLHVSFDDELLVLRSRYGLTGVEAVCIRNTSIRCGSRVPRGVANAFLVNNFATATELIMANDFAQYCEGLNFALTMKCLTRLSLCNGYFDPEHVDVAPGFSALSSTLECAHFGYTVSADTIDEFAKHVALLINLKELSFEFREMLWPGCESCGYGATEPSDTFGLSDATMLALASNCKKLTALLIYHPARISDTVVPKVIGSLKDIQVFWRGGKFLFPPIHNRGDFDAATSLLEGTWVRRALERRGYDVDNECEFEEYSQLTEPLP